MTSVNSKLTEASVGDNYFVEISEPIDVQEMDRTTEPNDQEHSIMVGAAAAGGCIGCLVGGPVLACLAGVGSAYGTTKQSPAGDCTRSMGRMALLCHDKAIEVNQKHHVIDKTKTAAIACWEKSKDMNERHKMAERTKGCLISSWEGIKKANQNYRIIDRTFEGIGYACTYVNDNILDSRANGEQQPEPTVVVGQTFSDEGESRFPGLDDKANGPYVVIRPSDL
jgi:hypothetical protein